MAGYTKDSVKKLTPLEFTRLRPDTYCGSTEDSTQLAVEIVTNAVDEYIAGNCSRITIDYSYDSNVMSVSDDGQGILVNVKPIDGDDRTVLEMVYGDVNTSGKFERGDDAVYKVSTGAFGIGASLANFLSHRLVATTCRDGKFETVEFSEGVFEDRTVGELEDQEAGVHGVTVTFAPSEEFFTDPHVNMSALEKKVEGICCLCPGLMVVINGREITKGGISDIISGNCIDDIFTMSVTDELDKNRRLDLSYGVKRDGMESVVSGYANYGPVESGTVFQAVRTQVAKTMTEWAKVQGLIKDNDSLPSSVFNDDMCLAFNIVSNNVRYDSQTKTRVSSTADNQFIRESIDAELTAWANRMPSAASEIISRALLSRKASEAAKSAREAVRGKKTKAEKVFKMPTSLVDATSKKREQCELIICEGRSAASGLVRARDSKTQAIYGVRGMMLSVRKQSKDAIFKNQEINNLVTALGLDVDYKNAKLVYDCSKLRYGKIISCTDADPAGAQISNLLFNILWYLCPELFTNGHVYAAIPPLFRVTTTKNKYVYLKGQKELDEYKKTHKSIKSVLRAKGLGELDADELGRTLLDDSTRNITRLDVRSEEEFDELLESLYGRKVEPRVAYIMENSEGIDYDCE